ncbi:MAG TPA: ABC transporter ATP-binding protein [Phytomonospora sp.]
MFLFQQRRRTAHGRGFPLRLELRGITKKFGALVANDHIDLIVEPGEIHALLGENGAGKSTLMNVLYGLLTPDSGEILIDDVPRTFGSPRDALRAGIGMVHQHFMLVPVFTVAENIMLGREKTSAFAFLDRRAARREVRELSERYGLDVDPDAVVEDIPVGVQQRVEIIKALTSDCDLLILDEPTAVLTPGEIEDLLEVMRTLRDDGKSIVFITHKLKEVKAIADKITVVRRGTIVGTAAPTASEDELAAMMVGRDVSLTVDKDPSDPGEEVLSISNLTVTDERGQHAVDGLDLELRAGEILGIAGVQGNGQTELAEAIMALRPAVTGSIRVNGVDVSHSKTSAVIEGGVGYIPEDRSADGLVKSFSIAENLVLNQYNRAPFGNSLTINPDVIAKTADERVAEYDVRTLSSRAPVGSLSGGNQQKVIVAREMSRKLTLLVAAQPTRGVDVGSIEFIHKRIVAERDTGTGVLLISSELDEVLALSDRIAVMYRGKILATVGPDTPREKIGRLMAGVTEDGDDPASDAAADPASEEPGA